MKPPGPCEWRGSCAIPGVVAVLATTLPNSCRSWASVGSCTPCFPVMVSTDSLLCSVWWKANTEVFSVAIICPKIPVTSLPILQQSLLSSTIKNIKCCRVPWISYFCMNFICKWHSMESNRQYTKIPHYSWIQSRGLWCHFEEIYVFLGSLWCTFLQISWLCHTWDPVYCTDQP